MWNDMKVIDADAHMHEPQDLWERYVEPQYQDRVPKVIGMNGINFIYEPDGRIIPSGRRGLRTETAPSSPTALRASVTISWVSPPGSTAVNFIRLVSALQYS